MKAKAQLAAFTAAMFGLKDGEVGKKFLKKAKLRLYAIKLPKRFCIIDEGELASHVLFLESGAVITIGNRWAEIERILNKETSAINISQVEG